MAIHLLHDCNGFRSGSIIGVDSFGTGGGATVNTGAGFGITNNFPLTKQGADPYIIRVENAPDSQKKYFSSKVISDTTGWMTMAFDVYFENRSSSADPVMFFLAFPGFRLKYSSASNALVLFDGDDAEVGRVTQKVLSLKWYRVVLQFQWGTSSPLKLWWGEIGGSHELLFDEAGMKVSDGTTNVLLMRFLNDNVADSAGTRPSYFANYVFMTSDQTNWDDNNLTGTISNTLFMGDPTDPATAGDWTVLGPYRSARTTNIPDVGDNLDAGTWDDAEEIPQNDANAIRYIQTGAVENLEGTVYCNDGSLGGPAGDADVDNQIVGCVWTVRKRTSGTGFSDSKIRFVRGKWNGTTLTKINTSDVRHTDWRNDTYVEGGSTDVRVPTPSEWMAMGMHLRAFGFSGGPWVEIADFYGTILHAETPPEVTRLVNLDGFIVRA